MDGRLAAVKVGRCTLIASLVGDTSGLPVTFGFGITPRPLTIKADAKTWVQGTALPPLTWTASGLVGSDFVSGSLIRAPGTQIGSYPISQGTLAASSNYTMTFVGSTFSIVAPTTSIQPRPSLQVRSTTLWASIEHPMAKVSTGHAQGKLLAGDLECAEESCLSMRLFLPTVANVRVSIFDQLGTPVISFSREFALKDLEQIGAGTDGRYPVLLSWNLRAANGAAVSPGVYLWKIQAQTQDGQRLETIKRMGVH